MCSFNRKHILGAAGPVGQPLINLKPTQWEHETMTDWSFLTNLFLSICHSFICKNQFPCTVLGLRKTRMEISTWPFDPAPAPMHILYACFHLLDERTDPKNYLAVLKVSSRWVAALSVAGANSSSTRSGARAKLWPGAPVPIVALRLLAGFPDTVALEAPLWQKRNMTGE